MAGVSSSLRVRRATNLLTEPSPASARSQVRRSSSLFPTAGKSQSGCAAASVTGAANCCVRPPNSALSAARGQPASALSHQSVIQLLTCDVQRGLFTSRHNDCHEACSSSSIRCQSAALTPPASALSSRSTIASARNRACSANRSAGS